LLRNELHRTALPHRDRIASDVSFGSKAGVPSVVLDWLQYDWCTSESGPQPVAGARKLLTGVRSDRMSVHVFPRYEVSSLRTSKRRASGPLKLSMICMRPPQHGRGVSHCQAQKRRFLVIRRFRRRASREAAFEATGIEELDLWGFSAAERPGFQIRRDKNENWRRFCGISLLLDRSGIATNPKRTSEE
jgi:hypothetical protein